MSEDIFGKLLWDFFNGKNVYEMTERDDGFISATPIRHYFEEYINWSLPERNAIRYVKGSILDIGCGSGRHSLFLQRNKHNVLGIDNSSLALKVSELRGVENTFKIDMFNIGELKKKFDTHLVLGNNVGLFGSAEKLVFFLDKLYEKTRRDGVALLGNRNPYLTKKNIHIDYLEKNKKKRDFAGKIKIKLRYKDMGGDWFNFLLLSPNELIGLIEKTSWDVSKVFGKEKKDYVILIKK